MEKKPLVSIVIPTYNRYQYLYDCVDATRSIDSDELEIIIQDNSTDNKKFSEYVNEVNDSRIKYYYEAEHVSVVDNCDKGVSHATGDYICMIGDDDTVCENIIKAAHYLKDHGIEGCCFPFPGFNWPDMTFENGKKKEANMFVKYKADGSVKEISPLEPLANNALLSSLEYMPRLYHALVSKQCVDRLYKKIGTCFPGPSPDMANAVATCLEVGKSVYISDYLIVSGYGKGSARGEGNRNQHFYKNLRNLPWLPKDTVEKWDKNIPQIFSGETIIAQSASLALDTMGADLKKYKKDYTELYATFFWHHKDARHEFLRFIFKSPKKVWWFMKGVVKRIKIKMFHEWKPVPNYKELSDVYSLLEAKQIAEEMSEGIEYIWKQE